MTSDRNSAHNDSRCSDLTSYWHNHPPQGARHARCFGRKGRKSKGAKCTALVKDLSQMGINYLPMCKNHKDQQLTRGHCQAIMPCGYKCLEAFRWTPPYPQFCPQHADTPFPCYILQVPVELRFQIFSYLLPDKPVPFPRDHRLCAWDLRHDRQLTYIMRLLQTNRQISDEVKTLLYGRFPISAIVTDQQIGMDCFWSRDEWRIDRNVECYEHLRDWSQYLPQYDFSLIRHLSLQVWAFPKSHCIYRDHLPYRILRLWARQGRKDKLGSGTETIGRGEGHSWLYDISHNLRMFVDHFISRNRGNLLTLDVKFMVRAPISQSMEHWQQTMVGALAILLEPTASFRGLTTARIQFDPMPEQSILHQIWDQDEFQSRKKAWESAVTSKTALPPTPPIFSAYIKLEEFIEALIDERLAAKDIEECRVLDELLHKARVAKELQDSDAFASAQKSIFKRWKKLAQKQLSFIAEMKRKAGDILDGRWNVRPTEGDLSLLHQVPGQDHGALTDLS